MPKELKITVNDNGVKKVFKDSNTRDAILHFLNYIESNSSQKIKRDFDTELDKSFQKLYKETKGTKVYLDRTSRYFNSIQNITDSQIKDEMLRESERLAKSKGKKSGLHFVIKMSQKSTLFFNGGYSKKCHFEKLSELFKESDFISVELVAEPNIEEAKSEQTSETLEAKCDEDTIFFGPPGTGKSYYVNKLLNGNKSIYRATFHPEYTYSDFIGQYKPVVGYHKESNQKLDGEEYIINNKVIKNKKPIVLYDFVPGVLSKALLEALRHPDQQVALVIEEINRGNCAAIFGDMFQLLDRNDDGESVYPIDLPEEQLNYFKENQDESSSSALAKVLENQQLYFPSNFTLIATMNTSDQSLFPMDSAFKRRWAMEYVPINYNEDELEGAYFEIGNDRKNWLEFLETINEKIEEIHNGEDKQIGQWFVQFQRDENEDIYFSEKTFKNKVLSYLFFDVFKYNKEDIFQQKSFSKLIKEDSLEKIFKIKFESQSQDKAENSEENNE